MALGRDSAHAFGHFSGPHFLPVKVSVAGFLHLNKSSGLSWSCTCLNPVRLPQTLTPVLLFLGGTFSCDLPVPVGSLQVPF